MTYGGLKNCSKTTYIPRNISVNRKYLPALSKEVSLRSSQRSVAGNRKPRGGGPAGVALRAVLEEKAATWVRGYDRELRGVLASVPEGRRSARIAVEAFREAILRFNLLAREAGSTKVPMWTLPYFMEITITVRKRAH